MSRSPGAEISSPRCNEPLTKCMPKANVVTAARSQATPHLTQTIRDLTPSRCILLVSEAPEDHDAVRRILCGTWHIVIARSCAEVAQITRWMASIILCEQSLPDGSWKNVLDQIAGLTEVPMLIVTSGLADAHLWAEVLNLGGYDVLAKPFDDQEVQRVVAGAWRQQQNRSEFALIR